MLTLSMHPRHSPNTLELLARVGSVYWMVGRSSTAWMFRAVRDLQNYDKTFVLEHDRKCMLRQEASTDSGSYLICICLWRCPRDSCDWGTSPALTG